MPVNLGQIIPNVGTSAGPAWTVYGGKTLLAWKGQGNDNGIYWSTTATLEPDSNSNQYTWEPQKLISNVGTSANPAVANLKGVVYLAWKGQGTDESIYLSKLDTNGEWTPQLQVPGVGGTSDGPALAVTGDTLYLAWLEERGGTRIFWSKSTDGGTNWSPQAPVPNVGTSAGPALASDGSGAMYLAWKGEGNDSLIWWSKCDDGKTWRPQNKGPGGAISGPALVVDGNNVKWLAWQGATHAETIPGVYFSSLLDESTNLWSPAASRVSAGTQTRPALVSTSGDDSRVMLAWTTPGENSIYSIYYGSLLLPAQQIVFDIPDVIVKMMRSGTPFGKTSTDTDYATIAVKVKGKPAYTKTTYIGELTGGEYGVSLGSTWITIQDTDTVYFQYSVINSSASASDAATFLENAATQVFDAFEKADNKAIDDESLGFLPLSALSPQERGAVMGAQLSIVLGLSNLVLPELGVIIGALAGWFANNIWSSFCPKCDGPVAFGAYVFSAPQIRTILMQNNGMYIQTDDNPGVTSAGGCGENSHYQVIWNMGT